MLGCLVFPEPTPGTPFSYIGLPILAALRAKPDLFIYFLELFSPPSFQFHVWSSGWHLLENHQPTTIPSVEQPMPLRDPLSGGNSIKTGRELTPASSSDIHVINAPGKLVLGWQRPGCARHKVWLSAQGFRRADRQHRRCQDFRGAGNNELRALSESCLVMPAYPRRCPHDANTP